MATEARRGSTLMLMPAAVLVLFVLAAMTVDQALVLDRQRDLVAAAEAAANDAAGAGLDERALYGTGSVEFDLGRARAAAVVSVRARDPQPVPTITVTLSADGRRVVVRLETTVTPVFARAVPGAGRPRPVHARADASLVVA